MVSHISLLLLLSFALGALHASDVQDNRRLVEIFEEDQGSRSQENIDWGAVAEQDRARRGEVLAIVRSGGLRTSRDYFHAAIIFQHGDEVDDYRLALSLAQLSSTLDPQNTAAPQLVAAAWDRILMSKGAPQWYGTQYSRESTDAPITLYTIDETMVSDEERIRMHLPTLEGARKRAAQFDRGSD